MKNDPLVSVIVPTYNRGNILPLAINSILSQTYRNIEIIVVDDGSTDNTAEVIKQFSGINYIYKENGGQASARTAGLQKANGSIVASLDSDDEWYPNFLETCVRKLTSQNLDFVFTNWDQQDTDGRIWNFLIQDIHLKPFFNRKKNGWVDLRSSELKSIYTQACPSPSSSAVIWRDRITNGWDSSMNIGDDWNLFLTLIFSKECKAAFCLDRLWKKQVDGRNIYDGRLRREVLERLYISDLGKMINDLKPKIEPRFFRNMQKLHIFCLVELAKHHILRESNYRQAFKLFSRSTKLNFFLTMQSIPKVIILGLQRPRNKNHKCPS